MADTRIQTRVSDELAAWLDDRDQRMMTGTVHIQAKLELGMWRGALAAELRRIRLTLNQANCIADILNGTLITPALAGSAPLVYYEVADAFQLVRDSPLPYEESTYGAKWEIDEQALLTYLRSLGPTADHALHDAVSRWWAADHKDTREGWAAVGLTVVPDPVRNEDGGEDTTGSSTFSRQSR
ncbi:hypothetical protein [Kitasatospora sp. NPDC127060]|uniref:hypothetical protein n=1 Tax=Kitasatospora sp. NPDC127060 TaxID=3347121 RepID=UPI00365F429E